MRGISTTKFTSHYLIFCDEAVTLPVFLWARARVNLQWSPPTLNDADQPRLRHEFRNRDGTPENFPNKLPLLWER
jgi:hypothetical protein